MHACCPLHYTAPRPGLVHQVRGSSPISGHLGNWGGGFQVRWSSRSGGSRRFLAIANRDGSTRGHLNNSVSVGRLKLSSKIQDVLEPAPQPAVRVRASVQPPVRSPPPLHGLHTHPARRPARPPTSHRTPV